MKQSTLRAYPWMNVSHLCEPKILFLEFQTSKRFLHLYIVQPLEGDRSHIVLL